MVVDVIDIRKRIEKIRNEVSEAIVSRDQFEAHEEALREDIHLSVSAGEVQPQADDAAQLPLLEGEKAEAKTAAPFADPTLATHRAMTEMMSMPSFTLNVKNRHSNRLLIMLFAVQLVTNLILIMVLLNKL
jgi:hypothetical protein